MSVGNEVCSCLVRARLSSRSESRAVSRAYLVSTIGGPQEGGKV